MSIDSQELKYRIEAMIAHLNADVEHNHIETHIGEDQLLWDFVDVVRDRAMEPCLQDMCDRLAHLKKAPNQRSYG